MIISELSVDYVSFDDDGKEISGIAISYKDNSGKKQRRLLEKPRQIGQWTNYYFHPCGNRGQCSVCGEDNIPTNYCPNCGAKMDEVIVR